MRSRSTLAAVAAMTTLVLAPLVPALAALATDPPVPDGQDLVLWQDFAGGDLGDGLRQSGGGVGTLTFADGVLTVNDRSADYVGIETAPGLLETGTPYTVSVRVRLAPDTPATSARWVGFPGYTWIGNASVTASEWTTITGTWTPPAEGGSPRLYLGTGDIAGLESYSYLIDDILITKPSDGGDPGQEPGTILIDSDFEDGTLQGWFPRQGSGSSQPTLTVVEPGADGSAHAAQVSERSHEGDGIQYDITDLLLPGGTYEVEAYVRFAPGAEVGRGLTLSLRTVTGSSAAYTNAIQVENASADGWTKVTGQFSVPGYDTAAELYVEARSNSGNTSTFLVDQIRVSVPVPDVVDTSLVPLKDTTAFPVGVAIDSRETAGSPATLLRHHFSQVTPENHMKVDAWYDGEGTFRRHAEANAILDFAQENDLGVYGHVLLWYDQTPDWFFQDATGRDLTASEPDKQLMRERLATHIDNVASSIAQDYGLYGSPTNPVTAWDVVNEVVSDQATSDGLRPSRWYDILGEEHIHLAFRLAETAFNETYAAPGTDRPVALFINDYNTEIDRKGAQYEALVRRMLAAGTPLDGVGHQFHVSINTPISSLEAALDRFAGLGLRQEVTELDVTINPVNEATLVRQGYFYRDAFALFRSYDAAAPAAEKLFAVTIWGLSDNRSWRSAQAPLLFDAALQAKPAYYGAAGGELPPVTTAANVFGGDLPLTAGFENAIEWRNLPENQLLAGRGGFQTRWNEDHLTVLVRSDVAPQRVEFTYDGATLVYEAGNPASVPGITATVGADHLLAVHLPHEGITAGATAGFDVRVISGGAAADSWNAPGSVGQLTFLEPLSYLEIPELTAPVVDGSRDAVWDEAPVVTTARTVEGSASGATAQVRTLWSGNTLYALFDVTDPELDVTNSDPWNRDSIEIFLDLGNSKSGSYGPNDTQIRVTLEGDVSFGTGDSQLQASRVRASDVQRTETGYVVELAIDLIGQSGGQSDVPLGGPDTFHGIDFQVNDGRGGSRFAVHTWAEPTGTGYQNTARWGVARLASADEVEPTPTPTPTDEPTDDPTPTPTGDPTDDPTPTGTTTATPTPTASTPGRPGPMPDTGVAGSVALTVTALALLTLGTLLVRRRLAD